MDGLYGVALGGLLGICGSIVPHIWSSYRAKKTARSIVAAYIGGLIEITQARRHLEIGRAILERWRAGDTDFKPRPFGALDPYKDPLAITITEQLGLLGPTDAADASTFLNILIAVRIDMRAAEQGLHENDPLDQRITRLEWDIAQWERATSIGAALVARLNRSWGERLFAVVGIR